MTHFIGAVVVPKSVNFGIEKSKTKWPDLYGQDALEHTAEEDLQEFLVRALDKFSENKETPRYVKFTKEQAIADSRADVKAYAESTYAKFLENPVAYAADCHNPQHLTYLAEEFPKKLAWTDEEHFENAIKYLDEDEYDAQGNIYSTYNPHSTWDWWTIGGRWEKTYRDRQGETVAALSAAVEKALKNAENPYYKADLEKVLVEIEAAREKLKAREITWQEFEKVEAKKLDCPAYFPWWFPRDIVVPDGEDFEWMKQGDTGWFGFRSQDVSDVDWAKRLVEKLKELDPEDRLVYIDFHV